eukprot:m.50500 g.50500  ORF g.50500 m.50500 type:complete len:1016 (+) comp7516_c0_seq1:171-3218(+)
MKKECGPMSIESEHGEGDDAWLQIASRTQLISLIKELQYQVEHLQRQLQLKDIIRSAQASPIQLHATKRQASPPFINPSQRRSPSINHSSQSFQSITAMLENEVAQSWQMEKKLARRSGNHYSYIGNREDENLLRKDNTFAKRNALEADDSDGDEDSLDDEELADALDDFSYDANYSETLLQTVMRIEGHHPELDDSSNATSPKSSKSPIFRHIKDHYRPNSAQAVETRVTKPPPKYSRPRSGSLDIRKSSSNQTENTKTNFNAAHNATTTFTNAHTATSTTTTDASNNISSSSLSMETTPQAITKHTELDTSPRGQRRRSLYLVRELSVKLGEKASRNMQRNKRASQRGKKDTLAQRENKQLPQLTGNVHDHRVIKFEGEKYENAAATIQQYWRTYTLSKKLKKLQTKALQNSVKRRSKASLGLPVPLSTASTSQSSQDSSFSTPTIRVESIGELEEEMNSSSLFDEVAEKVRLEELKLIHATQAIFAANALNFQSQAYPWMANQMELSKDQIQRLARLGVVHFNKNVKNGVKWLMDHEIIDCPPKFALFLKTERGLNKRRIGECLGENDALCINILKSFVASFQFDNIAYDVCLRQFLGSFHLPGEAQKIERILEEFAKHFHRSNPSIFSHVDTPFILSFSLVMLNTDIHNSANKNKMTRTQFIKNNSGIDDGNNLDSNFLNEMYTRIEKNEFVPQGDNSTMVEKLASQINGKFTQELVVPHRQFIGSCDVTVIDHNSHGKMKPRKGFLFNDILMVMKHVKGRYNVKHIIPLLGLRVAHMNSAKFEGGLHLINQAEGKIVALTFRVENMEKSTMARNFVHELMEMIWLNEAIEADDYTFMLNVNPEDMVFSTISSTEKLLQTGNSIDDGEKSFDNSSLKGGFFTGFRKRRLSRSNKSRMMASSLSPRSSIDSESNRSSFQFDDDVLSDSGDSTSHFERISSRASPNGSPKHRRSSLWLSHSPRKERSLSVSSSQSSMKQQLQDLNKTIGKRLSTDDMQRIFSSTNSIPFLSNA